MIGRLGRVLYWACTTGAAAIAIGAGIWFFSGMAEERAESRTPVITFQGGTYGDAIHAQLFDGRWILFPPYVTHSTIEQGILTAENDLPTSVVPVWRYVAAPTAQVRKAIELSRRPPWEGPSSSLLVGGCILLAISLLVFGAGRAARYVLANE